eukprot:1024962-Pyramimonas_sp.AAC.1
MSIAGWSFESGGPFRLRDGSPVSLDEAQPCHIRKYFAGNLEAELAGASVQGSNYPRAQELRDQGVWARLLRALRCGT